MTNEKELREVHFSRHGITSSEYVSVHYWLKSRFGKADRCESDKCAGKSKKYTWALIKGKKYERKRDNFMKLCYTCHAIYDCTENKRKIMRGLNENTYKTHCTKGHELSGDNLRISKKTINGHTREERICRQCHFERNKKWKLTNRENYLMLGQRYRDKRNLLASLEDNKK